MGRSSERSRLHRRVFRGAAVIEGVGLLVIAAPVKTKGGGGALLPAVVGICDPVRRDSAEAAG